jgi:putative ABC transport system substrate-binding protein
MMRVERRGFIVGSLGLLAAPLADQAQAAGKIPRVGFLFYGSPGPTREVDAFRQGLRELGYVDGQNITVEYRFASGQVERLPELATDLVRLKLDVIVTPGTPASMAAKRATSTIPIVFAGVADAVGAGLVASLARPSGNVTGLTSVSAELGGKRLELLKQMAAKASRVAVLYNPADRSNVLVLKELQDAAPVLGLTLQPLAVQGPTEFEAAFVAMTRERAHALFGAAGILTFEHRKSARPFGQPAHRMGLRPRAQDPAPAAAAVTDQNLEREHPAQELDPGPASRDRRPTGALQHQAGRHRQARDLVGPEALSA